MRENGDFNNCFHGTSEGKGDLRSSGEIRWGEQLSLVTRSLYKRKHDPGGEGTHLPSSLSIYRCTASADSTSKPLQAQQCLKTLSTFPNLHFLSSQIHRLKLSHIGLEEFCQTTSLHCYFQRKHSASLWLIYLTFQRCKFCLYRPNIQQLNCNCT